MVGALPREFLSQYNKVLKYCSSSFLCFGINCFCCACFAVTLNSDSYNGCNVIYTSYYSGDSAKHLFFS